MSSSSLSGVTFIKNGLTLNYPIKESIESISPLCEEVIINVGYDDPKTLKDDGTYEYLRDHFPHKKYRFIRSLWDKNLYKDGLILSEQTNIALSHCKGNYCFYIQGDEVLHQNDQEIVQKDLEQLAKTPHIHGLVFNFLHFFGNVNIIQKGRHVYRREIRLIKNFQNIISWKDAQGFRYQDHRKIPCQLSQARIFHYGWARKDHAMKQKAKIMDNLYRGPDNSINNNNNPNLITPKQNQVFYHHFVWGLKNFTDQHPSIMIDWIAQNKNNITLKEINQTFHFQWKYVWSYLSDLFEKFTGYRVGEYKNYKIVSNK